MIEVGYYPGCALHGTAAEYDESLRDICEVFQVRLKELEDWNCCGASSAHSLDEEWAVELAERNLRLAAQTERELLVPCAACFHRLKSAQKQRPGEGVVVWHVNEFFSRPEWLGRLRGRVVRPLRGLAGVAYYGCLTQRPPKVTDARQPEWPTSMDDLMETLGMEVRPWSYKTDCCGGSLEVARPELVQHLCGRLLRWAREANAECIVTACPLCQANLDISQAQMQTDRNGTLPVFYITELMALALGVGKPGRWWRRHMIDPRPLLEQKGLLAE